MGGSKTTRIDVEKLVKAIEATEWYGRLYQKWEWTFLMTTTLKDCLPNIPMFLADIISEAHVRSTIKMREMTFDIAGKYGLVGPAEHYLIPLMVFEVGAL